MEKCEGGSLGNLVKKRGILPEEEVVRYAAFIFHGYY